MAKRISEIIEPFFYDITEDQLKSALEDYPFLIMCAVIKYCPPRHERWEYLLNLGRNLIDKVFDGQEIKDKTPLFVFPERWMSVQEQYAFTNELAKHPNAKDIELVQIITSSPIIISGFRKDYVRIVTFEGEKDNN